MYACVSIKCKSGLFCNHKNVLHQKVAQMARGISIFSQMPKAWQKKMEQPWLEVVITTLHVREGKKNKK